MFGDFGKGGRVAKDTKSEQIKLLNMDGVKMKHKLRQQSTFAFGGERKDKQKLLTFSISGTFFNKLKFQEKNRVACAFIF